MLELKLICYCGQKYKFDVEPVNGLMPFTVKCPICNLDGTARANEMLAQQLAIPPKPPAPAAAKATTIIPPAAAVPPPPRAVAPTPSPMATAATPQVKAPAPAPPVSNATVSTPPKAPAQVTNPALEKQKALPSNPARFNLGLGLAGAALGSLVGCGLMYGISHFTHFRYLPIGVVVGVAAGYGAQWLARGCSAKLGIITAVIAGGLVAGTLWFIYGDFVPVDTVSIVFCAGVAYLASSGLMAAKPRRENR